MLKELSGALEKEGYEVLLDRTRLSEAGGDRWREALNTWMELCHGTIVLVDETALRSDWVKQELAILAWRLSRDPSFLLLPLVVPPVGFDALRNADMYPTGVGELEAISAEGDYILKVLGRCATLQRTQADLGSVERIENFLTAYFSTVEQILLRQAALHLGQDLVGWSPNLPPAKALARLMVGAGLGEAVPALSMLTLSSEQLRNVVALLATAWLDCRAIASVAEIAQGLPTQRALSINANEFVLPRWYIQRASGSLKPWMTLEVRIGVGEDEPDAIVMQVKNCLALRGPPGVSVKRYLAEHTGENAKDKDPLFLLFDAPEPDRKLLDRLRQEFPKFTFFCLTADYVPAISDDNSECGARFLRPELRTENVERAITAWSTAYDRLLPHARG